jgi:hypothetical protein
MKWKLASVVVFASVLAGGGVAVGSTMRSTASGGHDDYTYLWRTPAITTTPLPQPDTKLYSPPGFTLTVQVPHGQRAEFLVQREGETFLNVHPGGVENISDVGYYPDQLLVPTCHGGLPAGYSAVPGSVVVALNGEPLSPTVSYQYGQVTEPYAETPLLGTGTYTLSIETGCLVANSADSYEAYAPNIIKVDRIAMSRSRHW